MEMLRASMPFLSQPRLPCYIRNITLGFWNKTIFTFFISLPFLLIEYLKIKKVDWSSNLWNSFKINHWSNTFSKEKRTPFWRWIIAGLKRIMCSRGWYVHVIFIMTLERVWWMWVFQRIQFTTFLSVHTSKLYLTFVQTWEKSVR